MKIKIEIDESAAEDEVIIRCRGLTKQVAAVQRAVRDVTNASEKILLSRFAQNVTELRAKRN